MSYQPTEWTTGDVVTPQKLNKIEDGIQAVEASVGEVAASVEEVAVSVQELENTNKDILVINVSETNSMYTMDKTAQEIIEAFPNCIVKEGARTNQMFYYEYDDSRYNFSTMSYTYSASSLDDYPSHGIEE